MIDINKLLQILESQNKIKKDDVQQVKEMAAKDGEKFNADEYLHNKKKIKTEDIVKAKAELYNLPYQNLREMKIEKEAINIISSEVAENYKIICFEVGDKKIKVGVVNPDNFKAIEAVDFLAKEQSFHVEYYIISEKSFRDAIQQFQSLASEITSALQSKEGDEDLVTSNEKDELELSEVTKSAPVTKIVGVIIRTAVEGKASDIHIEPMEKETRVRYRIDGILKTSLILPRSVHNAIIARVKVMASLKLDETRMPQDGRIRLLINNKEIDFRVSILPLINTEKVVMRILDTTKGAPSLEDLGFWGRQLDIIQSNSKRSEGLLIVTGPTGSGKSTTLFSVLETLNLEGVNISTLEDPVEYQLKGANQSQVRPTIGYTFASGLRSFLRQDPDIIMVGEIRDHETAELAIHAALTGHSVLSTIHTTSAIGAIARFLDMDIEGFLLGSTLHTIIAQRLARKICPECKEEVDTTGKNFEKIIVEIKEMKDILVKCIDNYSEDNIKIYKGKGCSHCGNSGYKGRVSIAEVLDVNKELRKKIVNSDKHLDMDDVMASQEFISIREDGIIKVLRGMTTVEELQRIMKK